MSVSARCPSCNTTGKRQEPSTMKPGELHYKCTNCYAMWGEDTLSAIWMPKCHYFIPGDAVKELENTE